MKKIILILSVISVLISSCNKDGNKVKQVRLKTYTHEYYTRTPASVDKYTIEYNSANKISKVTVDINGALYKTQYCIYNSSNQLDSITEKNASGTLTYYYKINWTGSKITSYKTPSGNTTQLTYNSDGFIDRITYTDASYFRNEYKSDSVLQYYKPVSTPEVISARYKLSSTIKNPFLISGFDAESFVTGFLFYYNNNSNALLPNIEDAQIAYLNGSIWYQRSYTFEGDFNGYPLKRNDLTNTLDGNKSKETFTYEEF